MSDHVVPKHVAIIMDGNGRWAQQRHRPRIYGHVRGCRTVRDVVRSCDRLGVQALTLFAFSTENWLRPLQEVSILMRLLRKWLLRERQELMEMGIRVRAVGGIDRLPREVRDVVLQTVEMSQQNKGLELTLCLSYGGREEFTQIAQRIAKRVAAGSMAPEEITEQVLSREFFNPQVGEPDLLIRTSGEIRVSNFLLWQMAYSELYFTETMWPDFNETELLRAIECFSQRQRRFGKTAEQISATL